MNKNALHRLTLAALLGLACGTGPAAAGEAKPTTGATMVAPGVLPKAKTQAVPRIQAPETASRPAVTPAESMRDRIDPRLERIRDADQARGLKDLREIPLDAAHMPEQSGSLTDPTGANLGRRDRGRFPDPTGLGDRNANDNGGFENPMGRLAPDLPSNRDKGPNFNLGPSANPPDWMSGAASRGGTTTTQRNRIGSATDVISTTRDSDGNVTRQQRVTYDSDGNFLNSVTTERNADGSSRTTELTRTEDRVDMSTGQRTVVVEEHRENRDANGNVTGSSTNPGRVLGEGKADPPARDTGNGGIARTIDPNADTGGDAGGLCQAMPWVCSRGAPPKNPTYVNPGKSPGGFAPGPRIDPGDSIVVNPSTENIRDANRARRLDPDGARRAVESGTRVNPPGPND